MNSRTNNGEKPEGNDMETGGGSINPSEVATLSLLGGGVGGHGRGHYTGHYGSADPRVDGSAVKTAIDNHDAHETSEFGAIRGAFNSATRDRQFSDLKDTMARTAIDLSDKVIRGDTEIKDRINDVEARSVARDHAAELAHQKCCCETQKQLAAVQNAIQTTALETELRQVRDTNAAAEQNSHRAFEATMMSTLTALTQAVANLNGNGHGNGGGH
jgi:hypothetical protein